MVASASKKGDTKGRPNPAQENCGDLDICPDLVLAVFGAALAAAFAILYTLITSAGRRKRRRRDAGVPVDASSKFQDVFWNLGKGQADQVPPQKKYHPTTPI